MFLRPFSVVISLLFICLPGRPQVHQIKFDRLSTGSGLSHSNVLSILQDSRGFMWIGTRDGLNRYDGYKFTVYQNDAHDKNSLVNSYVSAILEDSRHNLWIGTAGGLDRFDRNKALFIHYNLSGNAGAGLTGNFVTVLLEDSRHNLWVGTDGQGIRMLDTATGKLIPWLSGSHDFVKTLVEDYRHRIWIGTLTGLNCYDPADKSIKTFRHSEKDLNSLSYDDVYTVLEDSRHRLWVGTYGGGLDLLDPVTGKFRHFRYSEKNPRGLPTDLVYTLLEDENGNIWIGTENGGLSIFNPDTELFENFRYDEIDNTSLGSNSINTICRDVRGNMWVGTFAGGISLFNKDRNRFTHYKHNTSPNSLSDNNVLCIFEDPKQRLWIGTDGGGLNLFDRAAGRFIHYKHEGGNANSISGNYVLDIEDDSRGNLWAATWGDGVSIFNPEKKTWRHFRHNPDDSSSLSSNFAWTVFEDREKNMWIGTFGGGLDEYDAIHNRFIHYPYNPDKPDGISNNNIYTLFGDSRGELWIGTYGGGLNLFNRKTGTFRHFIHDERKNSISSNEVSSLLEDSLGNLWIGTSGGLNYFDRATGVFTAYTTENGLPNNSVVAVLGDWKGYLWISTLKGLSRFNPVDKSFSNFNEGDGLQSNEFKEQASCLSKTGQMYFGGINGFNEFYPDSMKRYPYDPPLLITDFQLFNKDVPITHGGKEASPLREDISETHDLTLSYKNTVITFGYASLNYTSRDKKRYSYQLEGFDKEWNDAGMRRTVTYTNLDPGDYAFRVKGQNNDGSWSSRVTSIKIHILPPFWMTWWFRLLLSLCIIGGAISFYRIRVNHIRARNRDLERQVKERTERLSALTREERKARQEAEEANRAKSVFLATMSHEIRTPLNGVIGMTSLLAETPLTIQQQEYTDTILHCGEGLLNVINDILDFSKIDSGKMEMEKRDFDLRNCIEDVLDVFAGKASQSGLDLAYQIDYNVPTQIIGDALRLRQILMNLLGNAIKFTHRGEVFLGVHLLRSGEDEDLELCFEVRDTGIGIPADKIGILFKSFSQVDSSTTRKYGGSGLGLAICEKLVSLMGGQISVTSKPGEGTTFTFTILTRPGVQPIRNYVNCNLSGLEGKKVLVVDDNPTNREILKNQLDQWRLVPLLVGSGEEALAFMSRDPGIDLVITDRHMPGMDGVALAQELRNRYSKLPIMLLSSVGSEKENDWPQLFTAILTKPIKQSLLCRNVVNSLREQVRYTSEQKDTKGKISADFSRRYPMRILVAEDNLINQRLIVHVLSNLGYQPESVENGQEAVEAAGMNDYDMILMDIQMPELDGLEATKQIRRRLVKQPLIVALTANAMQGDREECLRAGMDDYISKPIVLDELIQLLEKSAGGRKMES
ncbi:MAG: two-component regulator propeller domain-containing protein [Puia sp.]|nr:two-component regulator propeller domain-containing protein [Puia sp.]